MHLPYFSVDLRCFVYDAGVGQSLIVHDSHSSFVHVDVRLITPTRRIRFAAPFSSFVCPNPINIVYITVKFFRLLVNNFAVAKVSAQNVSRKCPIWERCV